MENKRSLSLITITGDEIKVNYKINEDVDDYVMEEIRKALEDNNVFYSDYCEVDIQFKGYNLNEIDFRKIIGINWS